MTAPVDIAALRAQHRDNPARWAMMAMDTLPALLDELEALRKHRDTLATFAREFIRECWEGCSEPDGGGVQDRAVSLGILIEVEGGYDPEKHGCDAADEWGVEKGVTCFTFAPFVRDPEES